LFHSFLHRSAGEAIRKNKGAVGAAGAGVAGLAAGYAAGKGSDQEKKAAFIEGVYKQAMAYGFSEDESIKFAQQAAFELNN